MQTSADADHRLAISQTGRAGGAGATNACAISGSVIGSRDRRARATGGGATDSRSASAADEDAGKAMEKWKTKNRFPTFPQPSILKSNKNGRLHRRRKGDTSIEVRMGTFLTRLDTDTIRGP